MESNKFKLEVGRKYRTNELSLTEGGSTVEVHYENRVKVYTNVKNPTAYIKAIKMINENKDEKIIATYVDGTKTKHVWKTS
jgi:hypothetical protein